MKANENNACPQKPTTTIKTPGGGIDYGCGNSGVKSYQYGQEPLSSQLPPKLTMKVHAEGHIMDAKYKHYTYDRVLSLVDKSGMLPQNIQILKRFLRDARLGKTIKKGAKKKVGPRRLRLYLQELKKLDRHARKPFDQITQDEMERFILDLEEGRIQYAGRPYGAETQIGIKKIVIKFYKWLQGDCVRLPSIVEWIDTSYEIKDYVAVKLPQIQNLVSRLNSSSSNNLVRNRALLMLLFDLGARADELLNIRMKHVEYEKGNYWVRIEYSKTKPRRCPVPLAKEHLAAWLDIHPSRGLPDEMRPLAQLFPISYKNLLEIVRRAGKLIGVRLTPHGLRHSSVTYYQNKLSWSQKVYRYGWSKTSRQPQRYEDQTGIEQDHVAALVEADKVSKVKRENEVLNERLALMEEQLRLLLSEDIEEVQKIIKRVKARQE